MQHSGLKNSFCTNCYDQNVVKESRTFLFRLLSIEKAGVIESVGPTQEKRRKADDIFSSFYTASAAANRPVLNELEVYRTKPVLPHERDGNPIEYWNKNADTFPKLSKIARNLLAISATSCKSEQNFRIGDLVVDDPRTNLKSNTIDGVLFMKSNMRLASEMEEEKEKKRKEKEKEKQNVEQKEQLVK